jgi:uncharacterized Fe-S cluster-containing radical SAM superfamily protein
MDFNSIIEEYRKHLIVTDGGKKQYKIIKDFKGTYIEKEMAKEEKMVSPIFRVFDAAKPERGRKLNIDPIHNFDQYNDSLMDYASIIGYKLNNSWSLYNRLISFHVPLCPNDCWHCYVPHELYVQEYSDTHCKPFTAEEIIDLFVEQQKIDRNNDKHSYVLRITGGEPFLVPDLILDCLAIISARKELSNKVFVWTETNLEPFVGKQGKAFMDQDNNKDILKEMGKYTNFAVHPCFHGLSQIEFDTITGKEYHITLEDQINAVQRLVDNKIDVYPTFGSNVCDSTNIKPLFDALKQVNNRVSGNINGNLPLKVALVEYKCDYEPVEKKIINRETIPDIYSRFAALRIWNKLLLEEYGVGYGIIPRHLAAQFKKPDYKNLERSDIECEKEIIFFFKTSYRNLYHREILDLMAIPSNHIFKVDYDKNWVQEDLFFHMGQFPQKYKQRKCIWFYVDKDNRTLLPLRKGEIVEVNVGEEIISFKLKMDNYICFPDVKPEEKLASLVTKTLANYFGNNTLPPGGKLVLLGEGVLNGYKDGNSSGHEIKLSQAFEGINKKVVCNDGLESFQKIIPHLVLSKDMKTSLFYRATQEGLKKEEDNGRTIYKIKAEDSFKIKCEYFLPNYTEFSEIEVDQRAIDCELSSNVISIVGSGRVICSKYGSEELLFRTNKVEGKEEVCLIFHSKNYQFKAAKIVFHIIVEPKQVQNSVKSLAGAFLLALGMAGFSNLGLAITEKKSLWGILPASVEQLFIMPDVVTKVLNSVYILALTCILWLLFYLVRAPISFKPW